MHHVKAYFFNYSNHYYYQITIINYISVWYYLQYNKVIIYDKYIYNKVIVSLFEILEWYDRYYWYAGSHNHKATFEEFYAQVRK